MQHVDNEYIIYIYQTQIVKLFSLYQVNIPNK